MRTNKAVGIVFGNIHDDDVPQLTASRCLASVPFGGRYRLIDFCLSNMASSGITKVGIIAKRNYQSLLAHLGSGKSWDLSRKNAGIILLPPYAEAKAIYNTRFEAIAGVSTFIKRCTEDYIVMSDCDNVCNFDYDSAIRYHIEKNADITAIYRRRTFDASSSRPHNLMTMDDTGRVTKVELGDKNTAGERCFFTNMLVISRRFLLTILGDGKNYTSFSKDVMKKTNEYRIFGYELTGYYSCIDSLSSYLRHNLDLLQKENRDLLFKKESGAMILTKVRDSAPLRLENGSKVTNSFVADGCIIEGEVRNSVLFRGVRVAKGAVITNSVVMQGVSVSIGSSINSCVVDKNVIILDKRNLSGHATHPYFIAKNSVI
ncbi:MAG: glucose-1-phosphate adenylyltransferase subunit GlgD [Firmicutes bacterium]|nr:glucose-1-phosphate adenylyltransferase subunit GlgD [Bacillota bacterium]